jgi:hypothetical protein
MDPSKVAFVFDLYGGTGTGITSTGAGAAVKLPPGKKAIQVTMTTTSTMTVKIQNSVDGNNWFDISSSTVASASYLAEVDSVVPNWRVHVSSYAWAGAGTNVASIAQLVP